MKLFRQLACVLAVLLLTTPSYATLRIAHRGGEPESTLLGIQKTLQENSADILEVDTHRNRDGELVVIHDDLVDRTSNGKGPIADFTTHDMKKLTLEKGAKIPTLKEVLDLVAHRKIMMIEMKGENTEVLLANLIQYYKIKKGWHDSDFIIESFYPSRIPTFHRLQPNIEIVYLLSKQFPVWLSGAFLTLATYISDNHFDAVGIPKEWATPAFIEKLHKMHKKVYVFTADTPNEIQALLKTGTDGIFSNKPGLIPVK